MSETLCTLRTKGGGGGKQTETVLWTNPSPSSNFSSQDVTLSDNISNYDYIGIVTAFNTSGGNRSKTLMSVSDFKNSPFPQTGNQVTLNMGSATSSITMYRVAYYSSDTTIRIGTAVSSAGNTNNAYVIPTQIVGIKHMYGKMEHYATGYFTTGRTSVDLGFVPKYVFCANGAPSATSANTTAQVYDANVSTTQYHMFGGDVDEMRTIGAIGTANQFCMEGTVIGMNPNQNFTLFKNSKRYYWAIG